MHPVSAQSEDPQVGGADDGEAHQVEDEFEQLGQGRYENPVCEWQEKLETPPTKKVEEHNVTHLPLRVNVRGKGEAHKKVREQGEVPTVSMDYKSFGEASTGCVAAHVCEQKSAADKWVAERVCDDIDLFGHSGVVLEGDGEPALVQVQSIIYREKNAPKPASVQSSIQWVRTESSTRSYVSGTGNESSSRQALGHHREDRKEGTGMDG